MFSSPDAAARRSGPLAPLLVLLAGLMLLAGCGTPGSHAVVADGPAPTRGCSAAAASG